MKKLSEEEALERLLKIDLQSESAYDKATVTFAKEYLRRMSLGISG